MHPQGVLRDFYDVGNLEVNIIVNCEVNFWIENYFYKFLMDTF